MNFPSAGAQWQGGDHTGSGWVGMQGPGAMSGWDRFEEQARQIADAAYTRMREDAEMAMQKARIGA